MTPVAAPAPASAAAPAGLRADRLDALRGLALVWMAGFHFCFDLKVQGFLRADFYTDPLWTRQRVAIVSLFLLCAGVGQALALHQGQTWARFWRRWVQIVGCALLVTLASRVMFPSSFITFGVLHAMALLLIATRCLGQARCPPPVLLLIGLAVVGAPWAVADPFFDTRWTQWIGFVTRRPLTEDFVPVFPWWGVMLIGLAAGQWTLQHRPGWLLGPRLTYALGRALAGLGRWSLSFYMLHQVVLVGLVTAAAWWLRR
ncbi:MAG: heparan-alpha-glucosaminide N-acetyltransferase [Pseudomonadota bacterium]